jgi:hypothetical protein
MSIRNIKSSSNVGALTINGVPYTLARSDVFYYLKFIDYSKELFKAASNLTAKPTVIFYTENATNKVILDYSLANTTDKTYLSGFFANLTQTSTFNLTNAGYLDKSELEANIGCTLTFSEYKENKVFATVTAVTDLNTALDVYFADYFTDSPQLSKAGSLGTNPTTLDYALVSVNPSTSRPLSSLGLIAGDVIEVVNSDSVNNQFKFEISETTTINQQEVLRLKPIFNDQVPTIESLLGTSSLINLYVKGTSTETPVLSGDLGCCYNSTVNIENNTSYQCGIRGGFNYVIGSCSNQSSSSILPKFNTIIVPDLTLINTPQISSSDVIMDLFLKYIDPVLYPIVTINVVKGTSSSLQSNKIVLERDKTYTIRQSDPSNANYILRLSLTKEVFTPYVTGIYGLTNNSGIGNYLTLFSDKNIPTLYLFLESDNKKITDTVSTGKVYISTDYSIVLSDNFY